MTEPACTVTCYTVTRGGLLTDPIDADRARELYERASADPLSRLTGDLGAGFAYWRTFDGIRIVRVRVEPVVAETPAIP